MNWNLNNKSELNKNSPTEKKLNNFLKHVKTNSGQTYEYEYFFIEDQFQITLLLNKEKQSSEVLIKDNNCSMAINGSFYSVEFKPLGLLITNEKEISPYIESNLMNGIFWQSKYGNIGITRSLPDHRFEFALQSGPMLIENSQVLPLKISNDKQARRIVVINTVDYRLIFLVLYDSDSVFLGPKLADLPQALYTISQNEGWLITEALNMDGGSASMFKSKNKYLTEFKLIGSIICLKSIN